MPQLRPDAAAFFCPVVRQGRCGSFKKWGQLPAIDIQIPSAVANNLASSEVELYKKAVRLRAQNYGIGAMVYLRRVIENSMNSMLETLLALAMQDGVEPGLAEKLKKIQVSKRFDEKAEYAKVLLPPRLVRGGINPIDVLHDAFSETVHALSDEESVDLFDNTRSVFNYLFAQLKVEMEAQAGFIKQLNEIAKRGTRPAPTPTGKEQSSEPAATVEASQ